MTEKLLAAGLLEELIQNDLRSCVPLSDSMTYSYRSVDSSRSVTMPFQPLVLHLIHEV
jgi:hypothetical protein